MPLLLRLVPPAGSVAVFGLPDIEGNVVEVVRWLLRHDSCQVVWLTADGDPKAVLWTVADQPGQQRLTVIRKASVRGLWYFMRARTVFYSHYFFAAPSPSRGRTYVNVWHGDGPKLIPARVPGTAPDSYLVAGTRVWGRAKALGLGVHHERLLVVGNPRRDELERPASDESIVELGLDPGRPFTVWAPTFREAGLGVRSWTDTRALSDQIAEGTHPALDALRERELEVVVKPHPLDVDSYTSLGLPIVSSTALWRSRTGTYAFLARAAALITDYSSIWTDFLPLDRPIGLYCPDLDEYLAARSLDPEDFRRFLPGPLLRTVEDLVDFCEQVGRGEDPGRAARHGAAARLGAVLEPGATDRLMRHLGFGDQPRSVGRLDSACEPTS
jgi:CDP-glycerol glycerophosphotransferase (TagB/SpsB family)